MFVFSKVSENSTLTVLEEVPEGWVYCFWFDDGWASSTSNSIKDNSTTLTSLIKPSAFVRITPEDVGDELWKMLNLEPSDAPLFLITTLHPSMWEAHGTTDRFVQIRMGYLSDYDTTTRYLQKLAILLSEKDKNGEAYTWADRIEKLKRFSKKVPVLNLIGLGF